MNRYVVISADGHTGTTADVYRSYMDPAFRSAYDDYVASEPLRPTVARMISGIVDSSAEERRRELASPTGTCYRDTATRLRDLESNGIVGEVLFPTLQDQGIVGHPPFLFTSECGSPEEQLAGAWAYNRWLADYCSEEPIRFAGVGVTAAHDVDAAVAMIRWCADAGLRGGIHITGDGDVPPFNHPRYEPIWSTCEELRVPLHLHVALSPNNATGMGVDSPYRFGEGARGLDGLELSRRSREPLAVLVLGGILRRHPDLHVAVTEQGILWLPSYVQQLMAEDIWARQGHAGATLMNRLECDIRYEVGVDRIMWGADYPHFESLWPHSRYRLSETFHGISEDEVRQMIGGNAAALFQFDLDALTPFAERCGPTVDEVATAPDPALAPVDPLVAIRERNGVAAATR